jgi:hypothetical protein
MISQAALWMIPHAAHVGGKLVTSFGPARRKHERLPAIPRLAKIQNAKFVTPQSGANSGNFRSTPQTQYPSRLSLFTR